MENVKILVDGIQKDVYGLFYVFNSKYYFIYTEKEVDENDYVVLYMVQVGKETKNTENGPVDTGYMLGVEITNPEERQKVQTSISYIVEDKKNNTVNPQIQYLPMSMLTNLKIVSKKRFRLLKTIMVDNFKLQFENTSSPVLENVSTPEIQTVNLETNVVVPIAPTESVTPTPETPVIELSSLTGSPQVVAPQPIENQISNSTLGAQTPAQSIPNPEPIIDVPPVASSTSPVVQPPDTNVIVDYRSKYFEEEEKNKALQAQIDQLTQKLNDIKKVLE